jgi:hypothetical protein
MSMFDRVKIKAEELVKAAKPKADELREKATPLAQTMKERAERVAESLREKAEDVAEGLRQGASGPHAAGTASKPPTPATQPGPDAQATERTSSSAGAPGEADDKPPA